MTRPTRVDTLPLVGRTAELALLKSRLDGAMSGLGGAIAIVGQSGVGKSRLAQTFLEEAARRGCRVVSGRAYAAEQGVPYAPVADAFTPLLRCLSSETLRHLAAGAESELAQLFPGAQAAALLQPASHAAESSAQLLWGFTQFARSLAAVSPLVLLIDDLQWADAASRELLHFLIRNTDDVPLLVVLTVTDSDEAQALLAGLEQSLGRSGLFEVLQLGPLSEQETREVVGAAFHCDESVTGDFCRRLHRLTGGSPFFIDEILKALVFKGALVEQAGAWRGWDSLSFEPPRTVRDAVRLGGDAMSAAARRVADVAAVFGARVDTAPLRIVAEITDGAFADALDELCRLSVLEETADGTAASYDFHHPLVRAVLYDDIGAARRRLMHGRIAEVLEAHYGDAAMAQADQLARHLLNGGMEQDPRTGRYLRAAGHAALRRHADRAAADYLAAALPALADDDPELVHTLEDLARARLRLGELDAALDLLARARGHAARAGDDGAVARLWWRTGLAQYWFGAHAEALAALDTGAAAAAAAALPALLSRIEIARGASLHAVGRVADAETALRSAHVHASVSAEPAVQARAERALLLFHTWNGPPRQAHAHGERALDLARQSGDTYLECTVHWSIAVLHGLTGHAAAFLQEIQESRRLADELGSPFLRVAALELHIEYCYGAGEWDSALAVGERAIALARTLQLRALLPRVLVWTAFVYLGRDELDTAHAYIEEAARAAHADEAQFAHDVHAAVPVAIGRTAYHIAAGDWERAVIEGERGLALIDHTGFRVWAVHRLLPQIAEALLLQRDVARCRPYGERLRRDAETLEHELGLAWADTYDAFATWLEGDTTHAVTLLRAAAQRLEAVPYVYDAARLRRQLAGRLFDAGDRAGAVHELRRVHGVLAKLRARRELNKARAQFREMAARPQPRTAVPGSGTLTERETEIARLVAAGQSNKGIARRLGISPRTVGTHVSNIFHKLELSDRQQLEAWVRAQPS